ncbi:ABC transporter substrate-binding protein [Leucobacter sp. OH1287]|uniref:ABC transporter substrate-binding protein n=1 Tax=Leucobacter sp. OH1287 TaxID=2491049 RepID=UPI000F5E1FA0|nr:ABC transporter substrate-binding protein [Leucobacter sp. OH1287]RRD60654.1 amino acid ABC transporter substrate-binding protein [Leucobacter sp. OH1287]
MAKFSRLSAVFAAAAAATLVLAGCSNSAESDSSKTEETSNTITAGKLTIATSEPAYEPWVYNDEPEEGEGFEAAVAFAVANEMGYGASDVVWVRESFDGSIAPGEKKWDLNIQQFSITEERKQAVDFSEPYYKTTQAVVAAKGTDAANAKSVKDLKSAQIGVASGTTSLDHVKREINPDKDPLVFNNVADVVAALKAGNIDAMVTDLPGAFYVRDAQLEGDGVIVGQLPDSADDGDEFAFVLPKGSKIVPEVNEALKKLRDNGTLDKLVEKWLAGKDAPVLPVE